MLRLIFALSLLGSSAWGNSRTVLVYVHGGAWVSGSVEQYQDLKQRLDKLGFCTVLADYKLAHEAQHPQPIRDLDETLKNLKVEKDCDAKKIYLLGHSAGAHLIAFWASEHTRPEIKGFIGLEGIYDIPKLVEVWPAYQSQFIEAEFGPQKEWIKASPNRLKLKDKAPWLILQSKADELVDMKQSTDFAEHLKKLKIKVKLVELEKENHFGVVNSLGVAASPATQSLLDFTKN